MEELFHKARQIINLEGEYERNIKPQFPDTSFADWILSSQSVNSIDEFNTLYNIGKILAICDHFSIPRDKQPCNYQQHFQMLQRYINNPNLLVTIWQNALHLAGNNVMNVTLSHLSASSQQYQQYHTSPLNSHNTHNNVTYNNQIIINNNNKKKKRGRKKGTSNCSKKVADDIIIDFWKNNPNKTLLSVQQKFNAGYNRIKRLKSIALQNDISNINNNTNNDRMVESSSENDNESANQLIKKEIFDEEQEIEMKSEFAQSAYENLQKNTKRRAAWIQKTYKALEYLKKDISAYFFLKPVDKELCAAYDYDLVITKPMDFQTLENNLNNNKYLNLADFINDIELIFINAKIYNPPNHTVHKAAENLQKLFKLNFQSIIGEHADHETLNKWNYIDRPGGFQYGHQHYINHQLKKLNQKRKLNQENINNQNQFNTMTNEYQ
eukprot:23058_1